jgi:hypothetical protein
MSVTRRKSGPLAPFVDGYRVWLLEAGVHAADHPNDVERSEPAAIRQRGVCA